MVVLRLMENFVSFSEYNLNNKSLVNEIMKLSQKTVELFLKPKNLIFSKLIILKNKSLEKQLCRTEKNLKI